MDGRDGSGQECGHGQRAKVLACDVEREPRTRESGAGVTVEAMWIVIRLILAVIGFCVRQWWRGRPRRASGEHKGTPYYVKKHKEKKKTIAVSLGMPLRSPTWISMHGESRLDRFFKRIGVANEIETGDAVFDGRVYVTCDHPAVATALAGEPPLRAAIHAAFDLRGERVRYDGSMVWIERLPGGVVTAERLDALAALRAASEPLAKEPKRWFADRFLWKALLIEGMVWASFGYAIGAVVEYYTHREDFHVWPGQVLRTGLVAAAVTFVALLAVIALWMRGSSRGHRIIIESAIVLVVGLPLASIQVVGDTNRALDDAAPALVTRIVDHCEVREHRGRRGRRWYSYHVWIERVAEHTAGPSLPAEIEVTQSICNRTNTGDAIELEIGPGRWSIPWYRRIRVGGEVWTAPS